MINSLSDIQTIIQPWIEGMRGYLHWLEPYFSTYKPVVMTIDIMVVLFLLYSVIKAKITRAKKVSAPVSHKPKPLPNKDIEMIAGDDMVTTQLDLARAYIEMNKKHLAKSLLYHVSKQGKPQQQLEARQLIDSL